MEEKLPFEQAMQRLEEIVSKLERGDAPLDEMISLHEEGAKYVALCEKLLSGYEKKLSKLVVQKGE